MIHNRKIPRAPLALGVAGLTPFWILTLSLVTGIGFGYEPSAIASALVAYGAVILSFTGGIRWGIAVTAEEQGPAKREYAISVIPSLLGWMVLLLPADWQLGTLATLVILVGLFDYGMVCREVAPEWFGRLRLILAGGAGVALIIAAIAG